LDSEANGQLSDLLLDSSFWNAISQLAWPLVVLVVALFFRKIVVQLFGKETLSIKVAGMELSVRDAAQKTGHDVSDLQERLAVLEKNLSVNSAKTSSLSIESSASILWVDDFPSNNAFLIEKLEADGVRIRKELTTDSGIGALASDEFDLIISDLGRIENGSNNPFAGLDFARAVRAAGHKHPLLIFAGQRGVENRDRLLKAGVTQVTRSAVEVFKFVENSLGHLEETRSQNVNSNH
jgi:CheY-like chemotaxis protein